MSEQTPKNYKGNIPDQLHDSMNDTMFQEGLLISRADYDLSSEEMDKIESELYGIVKEQVQDDGQEIVVVAVSWGSKYAAFGRTSEAEFYETENYDLHKGMIPYENRSLFLYTMDNETGAVGHVKRVVFAKSAEEVELTGLSGLEIIDDRITSSGEEHAELDEILQFHGLYSPTECLNVASNHRMKRPGTSKEKPYLYASYKAVFDLTRAHNQHAVLAYLNDNAIRSFAGFGLQYELLGGKEYHVPNNDFDPNNPESEPFETGYTAVCIKDTQENVQLFQGMGELIPATNAPIVWVE